MTRITIATAALNQTPFDWDGNLRRIGEAIEAAKKVNAKTLVLPELSITGYGCEDQFFSRALQKEALEVLDKVAALSTGIVTVVGLPLRHHNRLYNVACVIADTKILGFVAKRYLANDGIHYETRWFAPWPANSATFFEERIPLGDIYFELDGIRLGVEICEDAWVPNRPMNELSRRGIDVIANPSASHFAFGKSVVRERYIIEASRAAGCVYALSNLVGCESGRIIFDGHAAIATRGGVVARGNQLSMQEVVVSHATVDIEFNRLQQSIHATLPNYIEEVEDKLIKSDFSIVGKEEISKAIEIETRRPKEEEFCLATTLGLYDYLRKSKSKGFVVSLSGGADSSAVSVLVSLMIKRGLAEVGKNKFLSAVGLPSTATSTEISEALLCCVYQKGSASSAATLDSACTLARSLEASFGEIDVEPLVAAYLEKLTPVLGRTLSWKTDDVSLQNIQARVRSPGIWLVANARNALLLTTGNRSETSVGYMTMDGDSSGGLNPIGGVSKHFLRNWLLWMEKTGTQQFKAITGLAKVNSLIPSAELRTGAKSQTDEEDLMPYELLDEIERYAVHERKSPAETLELAASKWESSIGRKQLVSYVKRFYSLYCQSQWKRERLAVSFHLDDYNLDPRSWNRFPILSGGFAKELAELQ